MIQIFENELEKGTGVPYMLIKNGIIKPSLKIDSILLDNIIYDKTVDHKRKGSRAEYLYKIISIYDNKAGIFSEVLRFFQKNTLDKYYDEQLFDFVLEMVKDGKADKKILYNKVRFYINKNDEFCGIKSFIEYEGILAAEFAACELGKLLKEQFNYVFSFDGFYYYIKEKDELFSALEKSEDECIKFFMQQISELPQKPELQTLKRKTADEIIQNYFEKDKYFYLKEWLETAEEEELKKIALFLLKCRNENIKINILCSFDKIKLPLDFEELKNEFKKASDIDYKAAVLGAMLPFKNREVLDLIFDCDRSIKNQDILKVYIKALAVFCSEDDKFLLLENLDKLNDSACHEILPFLIENENLKEHAELYRKILYKLYSMNRCSVCRKEIFDKIIEFNFLDEKIIEESMYDCNKETARKAAEIFKRQAF